MMGRPEERLDRDGSPVREFAWWLRDLRNSAGLTYDQLGRAAHYATSTVQAATAGDRLPTLRVTMAFVNACGGDAKLWRAYWTQIRRQLDQRAPAGVRESVAPPWADGPPSARAERPAAAAGATAGASAAGSGADGWFMESFSAVLNMDSEPVEALEWRRIVATADGLRELVTSVTVPRHPDDGGQAHGLESELLYGGSIQARQQPYDSFFQNVIVLPRPLRAGERHEYAIRLRVPPGQRMNPHYVHVPYRRSDRFELRVRFAPARVPDAVWLVRDAPTAVLYRADPGGERLTPDRFGEVYASFVEMRPGLGYGIRWREPEADRISPGS
jgi:hypothetical protein